MPSNLYVEIRQVLYDFLENYFNGQDVYYQVFLTDKDGLEVVRISIGGREFDYITVDITDNNIAELMTREIGVFILPKIIEKLRAHNPIKSYEDLWEYEMVELDRLEPAYVKGILDEEHDYFQGLANRIELDRLIDIL